MNVHATTLLHTAPGADHGTRDFCYFFVSDASGMGHGEEWQD